MRFYSYCLIAFIFFITASPVLASIKHLQGTLTGKITDLKTGQPLQGAFVYIADLKTGASTNESGIYEIKNLPVGNYLVEVSLVGYKSISINLQLKGDTQKDFLMEVNFVEGTEVVVTGMSKASQAKLNPIPIVLVNHDYMITNLSTNAIDAIAKIPGVRTVTTGPNVSKPFIRGLGYNRILTLYDGIRQEGQQWGDEHGIEVDQFGVDKIEIIKGPASLSYGSDALAGVVNIIPTQPAPEGKMIGEYMGNIQTNNKMMGNSLMLGASKNGYEWMLRGSHKFATNYKNPIDGRVYGTAFDEHDYNLSIGIHRSWGFSHLTAVLYRNLQEIPDGSRDSATRKFTRQISEEDTVREIVNDHDLNSYQIAKLHQEVKHRRIYWSNNIILGRSRLAVNLGFQNSVRKEFSHPVLYNIPGLFLQLNSFTYDVKYSLAESNQWNFTTGVNGMYQQNNSTKGTEFLIPSYHQFDIGPFLLAKKTFQHVELAGGIRFDVRNFSDDALNTVINPVTGFEMPVTGADTIGSKRVFESHKNTFSGFSGSLGITYIFNERLSFKLNIARGYRAPNIAELASGGVHPGTNIYQIGNPGFSPEFSLQEDLGFLYAGKYVVSSLSIFNNNIDHYIYNRKLTNPDGSDLILVPGNQTFQFQSANAHLYGGEFSLDVHPVKSIHFENSISFVYALNQSSGKIAAHDSAKYLPFIPPAHGTSELRWDFECKKIHFVKGFIKTELEYYAAQNRVYLLYNSETPTPGYQLLNAGIGGSFTNNRHTTIFNIYFLASNLLNTSYQDHLSRLKYFEPYPGNPSGHNGIYNMGRNFSIKLSVPFSFKLDKHNN